MIISAFPACGKTYAFEKMKSIKELNTLEGFKPKIIEGVASDSDYSILDILESLELFKTVY